MPSEVVPGDSMDPTHAATVIVASPAWDLAVATSAEVAEVPAGGASAEVEVPAVAASVVVVEAAEVAVVVAGKCCESWYEITGARI